jgi:hypothetical protein
MFCPNCSEPKPADATQFCKRCGLDLFGLSEFIESGDGKVVRHFDRKHKGLKQSALLFAIGFLLIPVWMFIGGAFPPSDRLVESAPSTTPAETLSWIGMWIAFGAGVIRITYSLLFEGRRSNNFGFDDRNISRRAKRNELSSGDYFRPADAGSWKVSEDLFEKVKTRHSGEL